MKGRGCSIKTLKLDQKDEFQLKAILHNYEQATKANYLTAKYMAIKGKTGKDTVEKTKEQEKEAKILKKYWYQKLDNNYTTEVYIK